MSKKPKTDEEGYALLLTRMSKARIAEHLGIKKQNLTRWTTVPAKYVPALAEKSGLPREYILPSLFA